MHALFLQGLAVSCNTVVPFCATKVVPSYFLFPAPKIVWNIKARNVASWSKPVRS